MSDNSPTTETEITRAFVWRLSAPRSPRGGGPWCGTCDIRLLEAGPGCPWRDCPNTAPLICDGWETCLRLQTA